MDLIKISIEKPVTVLAVIILVLLFGMISMQRLPYQLSPTVIEPEITVSTTWRGATPYEIEREIVEEQESVLKSLPGLIEMESDSSNSVSRVTLRFTIGTDVNDALLRVSSKLNEVSSYPANADNPVISATGAARSPVAWIILKTRKGSSREISTFRTFFEEEIRQHLERIQGVAGLLVGGGTRQQLHIIVNPEKLVAHRITINALIRVLSRENANISAGNLELGRRDFRIRTTSEFKTPEDIEEVVISSTGQRRIRVRDVAQVRYGYEKETSAVTHNFKEGIIVGFRPEHGANVLEMTDRVKKTVEKLNRTQLKDTDVQFTWIADQTPYIRGAINIIKQNILVGGILAIIVLLLFTRSLRATVVVSTAIPISILGTFIFLDLFGRNLNVVSLAGISFAVGMLVDSAIVVIENIDRHRKMGKTGITAAYDGTREVWGAILSSTLTTVAVFLPVVFLEGESGQLFKDIAIAVVFAIVLSLFVSVSVIPMFAASLFGKARHRQAKTRNPLVLAGAAMSAVMMKGVTLAVRSWVTRLSTVGILVVLAVVSVKGLMPKMEYLPQGNRNFVMSIILPPPGLSQTERRQIGDQLYEKAAPYMGNASHDRIPGIMNMFYVGSSRRIFLGAMSSDWERAGALVPLFKRMVSELPGMYGVAMQVGIFQTRLGRGRTVDIDISGADLNQIIRSAGMMFGKIRGTIPGSQVRPVPSIELMYPEVNIVPDRDRLRASNMSSTDLGIAVDVLMDGRDIGDFKPEGEKKLDIVLKTRHAQVPTPEDLVRQLVVTPSGKAVPVSSLASIHHTTGITRIRHLERNRTVTLQVTPPLTMPLETAIETIENEVIAPLRSGGMLKHVDLRISGAAGKLTMAREAMQWNFILAAIIAYLLMASLFGNFLYPLIIMFTVPLAGAGGFIGLWLLDRFVAPQPMDILTMLGFVILIGVVVNNAILIVHQAVNNVRDGGMEPDHAVLASTKSRLRPIYMSAATSILGMLPLVIFPGAGTELYKGLGSVILGGIAVSTVFTVFVIPSLLIFVIQLEKPAEKEKIS